MEKKYLYFQPEYVGKFKCDSSKCNNNCCERNWEIDIDETTYKKIFECLPQIVEFFDFNKDKGKYLLTKRPCPFLTEKKLCRLQLEYGEDFLSVTCVTYPRNTFNFGKFFERSLTLTCPVAAELILFQEKPLAFGFVEVPEKIHSGGGKILMNALPISEENIPLFFEGQIAMISILQARRFSIDQRLIILGLFLDKFQELLSAKADKETFFELLAKYESEEFLAKEMPPLFQNFPCDTENFILFIIKFIGYALPQFKIDTEKNFIGALEEVFELVPDEQGNVPVPSLVAKYQELDDARKIFLEKYSTFLENYLVNELFMNCYPYRFLNENITRNCAIFIISYKIFELILFAATHKGFTSKEDLLEMVDWFSIKMDHNKVLHDKFFELLKGIDDIFLLMTCLLKG